MKLTIDLSDEEVKILEKRAKKNMLSLREMIEDIVRRSCIRSKISGTSRLKCDDKLVGIFSKEKRGRKRKAKRK